MEMYKYTPTESKWINKIPVHWECKKIGSLFIQRNQKVSDKDYEPLSVSKNGIVPQLESAVKSDAGDNRKLVLKGDFVINSRSDRKGSCGVSSFDGSVSLINIVLKPQQDWNEKYVHYLLRSHLFSEEYYRNGRGIVADLWTTRYSEMKSIMLPVPPREEQDQIVRYLDWQTSKINKLIAAKKKQIEVLKELWKATIDKGILYGFSDTEKKDSGIHWLGEIPSHWNIIPLKRLCKINASISDLIKDLDNQELVTFLPMENVSVNGDVDYSIKRKLCDVKTGYSSFAQGDVVIAKITPCFENGKGACLDDLETEVGFGTTEFINLRPYNKILSKYLYMITITRPFRKLGEETMTGSSGQKRVSLEYVKNFTLGVPSIEEQYRIIEHIQHETKKIDDFIYNENKTITILEELKIRLISDVVTGQIDVRDIEIPDFEMMEETITTDMEEGV